MFYAVQLHLESGEQFRFAFPQLQLEQSPLQEHLISSLHDEKTSEIVIQTGTHDCDSLTRAKSRGDGFTSYACALAVQILA